ncbi:MAG: O-antigen ligase family protein [Solirubrobacteraceae bacterium]
MPPPMLSLARASRLRRAQLRRAQSTIVLAAAAIVISAVAGVAMVKLGTVQRELKAILLMAAALAMVLAALRPHLGIAMLLAFMPFEYGVSGTGTDQVLIIAVALMVAWRIQWRALPPWVAVGGVAIVLGSFASVIVAHDTTTAAWGAVRWLAVIAIMFAAFKILRDVLDASARMVDIFTISAVVVVVFALAQKVGVDVIVHPPSFGGLPDSFFGYYTVYGGYLGIAATLATGETLVALGARRRRRGLLYAAALVMMLVGLAIATSRGGLLALGAGWLLLLAFNVRRGPVFGRAVVILVVVVGASYLAAPRSSVEKIERRATESLGPVHGEDQTRFALQQAGLEALSTRPLGLGYGNFPIYLLAHVRSMKIQMAFDHAHETFIQMGLDAGWLGLAGFLMICLWPFRLVVTTSARGGSAVRASACAAALGAFLAQGLFDYLFYEISFLVFVATLVWATAHATRAAQMQQRPSTSTVAPPRPAAVSAAP